MTTPDANLGSNLREESVTLIAQRSLGLAEHDMHLANIETDDSPESRAALQRFDARRRQVLEAMDWTFARGRFPTAQVEKTIPAGYAAAYEIPKGTLRVRRLEDSSGDPVTWSREGSHVVAGQTAAQIVVTLDIKEPKLFAPSFTAALEFLLASDFSMLFSRSANRQQVMLQNFRAAIEEADRIEGFERSDDVAYAPGPVLDGIAALGAL